MKIGLYCGTFKPFHLGHLNIYQKALELPFEKVVVARGQNPDKGLTSSELEDFYIPGVIYTTTYCGLTTDLIMNYRHGGQNNVTLIRGIRNGNDYDYEMSQIEVMRDMLPSLQVILIPCDRQFAHISSTMIRNLEKLSQYDNAKKYLPQ